MSNSQKYYDTNAAIQVLGNIFINPTLVSNRSPLALYDFDFCIDFHKIMFNVMNNLVVKGATEFTIKVIEDDLAKHPESYAVYKVNNGASWINHVIKQTEPNNLEYYYDRLKKMTLLREYNDKGIDVSWLYDADCIDPKEREKQEKKFDSYTMENIAKYVSDKIEAVNREVFSGTPKTGIQAGEGLHELLESLKDKPIRGYSLYDPFTDIIAMGARPGCFYLRSAQTGCGKSRSAMADACYLACSEIYDTEKQAWIKNTNQVSSLFLSVELNYEELMTMATAFVAGIDEDIILEHQVDMSFDTQERMRKAEQVIQESPIYFLFLPDYTMMDIENTIIHYVTSKYNVKAVFFDYLTSSMSVIQEIAKASNGMSIREDQILFLLASRIKDIAGQYGIFIFSSTQLNGSFREAKILDQNVLAGAKAIANRIDFGEIMIDVTDDDLEDVYPVMEAHGIMTKPNIKASIYKNRRGKYNRVICWMRANKGQCRYETLFVTNYNYEWIDITELDYGQEEVR